MLPFVVCRPSLPASTVAPILPGFSDAFCDHLISDANLSTQQIEALQNLRLAYKRETEPLFGSLDTRRNELRLVSRLPRSPDQLKTAEAERQIRSLCHQVEEKTAEYHRSVLNVLGPEQKGKFRTHIPRGRYGSFGRGMEGTEGTGKGPVKRRGWDAPLYESGPHDGR